MCTCERSEGWLCPYHLEQQILRSRTIIREPKAYWGPPASRDCSLSISQRNNLIAAVGDTDEFRSTYRRWV